MKPRRGVSEILATMIVLMIVSSLGVMLYNISTSNLSSQQSNLLSQVETQKETVTEKFDIISITRKNSTAILIYYLDYGTIPSVISSVYLECTGKTPSVSPSPQLLTREFNNTQVVVNNQPSNIHCLTLSVDQVLTDNYYVTYKIVSQRGNFIESQG
jgi:hypothetical protein